MFFNALRAKPSPLIARPLEEQEERESQKLWAKTAQAVRDRNHELATEEKTKIEDMQREEAAVRANDGVEWHPRLFRRVKGGPGGSEEGEEDLEWIINAQMSVDCQKYLTNPRARANCHQRPDDTRETGRPNNGDLPDCQGPGAQSTDFDPAEGLLVQDRLPASTDSSKQPRRPGRSWPGRLCPQKSDTTTAEPGRAAGD